MSIFTLSFMIILLESVSGSRCGVCNCYERAGYVSCVGKTASEVYLTLTMENLRSIIQLDLRDIVGTIDMDFYSTDGFPSLQYIDLTGSVASSCDLRADSVKLIGCVVLGKGDFSISPTELNDDTIHQIEKETVIVTQKNPEADIPPTSDTFSLTVTQSPTDGSLEVIQKSSDHFAVTFSEEFLTELIKQQISKMEKTGVTDQTVLFDNDRLATESEFVKPETIDSVIEENTDEEVSERNTGSENDRPTVTTTSEKPKYIHVQHVTQRRPVLPRRDDLPTTTASPRNNLPPTIFSLNISVGKFNENDDDNQSVVYGLAISLGICVFGMTMSICCFCWRRNDRNICMRLNITGRRPLRPEGETTSEADVSSSTHPGAETQSMSSDQVLFEVRRGSVTMRRSASRSPGKDKDNIPSSSSAVQEGVTGCTRNPYYSDFDRFADKKK